MLFVESLLVPVLLRFFSRYFSSTNLNFANLKLSLFSGDVVLKDVELRLDSVSFGPVRVARGFIKELKINIPWTSLGTTPIRVTINNAELELAFRTEPAPSTSTGAEERAGALPPGTGLDHLNTHDGRTTDELKKKKIFYLIFCISFYFC